MRTTNFDAIAAASPLNREASVVRDGSGDTWEPSPPPSLHRWIAPPKLKAPHQIRPEGREVLKKQLGRRYGRFVVLGIWADGPTKKATWVCRCDCGAYEGRKLGRLMSGEVTMCWTCERVERLRATDTSSREYREASERLLDRLASEARK